MLSKTKFIVVLLGLCATVQSFAQFRPEIKIEKDSIEIVKSDTAKAPMVLTLEDALRIALSENISVQVADQEVMRSKYAKKGAYSALFPQVNGTGAFQRTIKKQVMYIDFDMSKMGGMKPGAGSEAGTGSTEATKPTETKPKKSADGIEVGRWNTYNVGISAVMPIINAQLWQSLKISGQNVDLAIEKARESRLEMVTQVKQAYYSVLLSKEAFNVYKEVYQNAYENYTQTKMRYDAKKASELDLMRAKSNLANSIPNVYNAENSVMLALWQLKAVIGLDLEENIDVAGKLEDYSHTMLRDIHDNEDFTLKNNTNLKQLAIQAEQLAQKVKMDKMAYLPTLSATFSYSVNAMANDFKFSEYRWTPYSVVGLSLSIPIFSGGKRYTDIKQSKIQRTELNYQRIDAERKLRIAIRQYLSTMETNMNTYDSSVEAVSLAQKAYDIAAKSYALGKSTLTDLNSAQLALTQARLASSQAIYNFMVAKSNLEKTLGAE